jgi:hypothetical protein
MVAGDALVAMLKATRAALSALDQHDEADLGNYFYYGLLSWCVLTFLISNVVFTSLLGGGSHFLGIWHALSLSFELHGS